MRGISSMMAQPVVMLILNLDLPGNIFMMMIDVG
jgi:hypothetical protein